MSPAPARPYKVPGDIDPAWLTDPRWKQWVGDLRLFTSRKVFLIRLAQHGGSISVASHPEVEGQPGALQPDLVSALLDQRTTGRAMPDLFRTLEGDGMIEVTRISPRRTGGIALTDDWRQRMADLLPTPEAVEPEPEPVVPEPEPDQAAGQPEPGDQPGVPSVTEPVGLTPADAAAVAGALLDRVVGVLAAGGGEPSRDDAASLRSEVRDMQARLARSLEDRQALKRRLDEAQDRCVALTAQVTRLRSERDTERDAAGQLRALIERIPPPADDRLLRDLDRLMRQVPRAGKA